MAKLSQPQIDAIDAIREAGGAVIPFPGGYWCDQQGRQIETRERENSLQTFIQTRTIRALVNKGELIEYGKADYGGRKACHLPDVQPPEISREVAIQQATLAAITRKVPSGYLRRPAFFWLDCGGKKITLDCGGDIRTADLHLLVRNEHLICEAVGENGNARLVRTTDRCSLDLGERRLEDCNDPDLIWLHDRVVINGIVNAEDGRKGEVKQLKPHVGEALVDVDGEGSFYLQISCLTRIGGPALPRKLAQWPENSISSMRSR